MDDLLICSQTEEEHLNQLELAFEKFIKAGIKLKMSKCEFFKNKIEYLGHLVSGHEISPKRQKLKAIIDLALITNIAKASHMIGLMGYCKKFFPVFSDMIRPLNELTKKNVPLRWTEQCQKSLDYLKQVITMNPILVYPDKQYYLFMDSSRHSCSGILI